MDERLSSGECTVTVVESPGEDGTPGLVLMIENAIEDRVRVYSRLMRMKQVLKKSRQPE